MKFLVEVRDKNAAQLFDKLKSHSLVQRVNPMAPSGKAEHIARLLEAIHEISLVKRGLKKATPLKDVLAELDAPKATKRSTSLRSRQVNGVR